MARVQRIIDRVQKSIIDFPGGPKEKNSFETDYDESLSPDGAVPQHSSCTIADIPSQDNLTSVNKSILIVEDELIPAHELQEILVSNGYPVTGIASTVEGAIGLVNETRPDLILMDIDLGPGSNGIEAAERILAHVSIPIIYITTYIDSALVTRAKVTNPYGYILKPLDSREIRTAIEIAFHELEKNEQYKKGYDEQEQRGAARTADLKRINGELQKSNECYRSLLDCVPVGIYRSSPAGQILDVNSGLVHILGYPDRTSLLAVNVHDVYGNPEDCKQWQEILRRDGVVRNFEVQFRTYDGSTIWVLNTGEVALDDSGRVEYYNGIVEDISERKRADADFTESVSRYRAIVEDQTELICRFAPDGTLTFVNDAYCRYFGLDRNDCIGKQHTVVLLPDDNRMMKTHMASLTPAQPFASIRHRIIMPSGEVRWQRWTDRAIVNESGAVKEYQSVGRDITDVVKAEEALRENENRYRTVVEDQTELICRFAPDGTLTFVNDAYCRYFGLDRNDCIGKQHPVVLLPEDNRMMKKHMASLTPAHTFASIRHRIIMPSGEVRWQRWTDRAIFNESGVVTEYQSVGRDITDVIQGEEMLRETKEYLEKLIHYANAPIIVWNPHRQVIEFNHAFETITGMTREEVIGQNIEILFAEKSREESLELFERTSDGLSLEMVEIPVCHVSGEIHIVLWNTANIVNSDGTIIATIAQGWDITKRRQVEKAQLESENHYRQLVEMSPDAILILNDSRIMELNSAALTLFGASGPRQLVGKSFVSLLHPDSQKAYKKWIRWEMNTQIPYSPLEQKIVQLDGTILETEAAAVPVTYHGRPAVQVIARDITQRKVLENQVKNQKEILEKQVQDRTIDLLRSNEQLKMEVVERKAMQEELTIASNEKDLLLREIHHRVKNNLQLIIGLIDMTKMRTHEPGMTAVLTDIMAKIHTMGFVHTRLYESKRFDKINMKQQVTELVDMTSGFYSHEHCMIDFVIDCDDIYLPVDLAMPCALALNELLSNIHKHAFKGRRSGIVEISASGKNGKIRMVIRDNGVGLPKGFDIEQSNRLGLKLMRALIEQQLHGSVTIKSENGTRVVIEIPLTQEGPDHGKSTRS